MSLVRSPSAVFTYSTLSHMNSWAKISKVCVNKLSFNPLVLHLHCRLHTRIHTDAGCRHTALWDKSNVCHITDLPVTIKDGLSPTLTLIHAFSLVRCLSRESDGGHRATKGKEERTKQQELFILIVSLNFTLILHVYLFWQNILSKNCHTRPIKCSLWTIWMECTSTNQMCSFIVLVHFN